MSSYVFEMEGHSMDSERVEMRLDDPEEACAHTVVAIGELLKNHGSAFWQRPEWRIDVTDESGATLCTLTIKGDMSGALELAGQASVRSAPVGRVAIPA